MCNVCVPFSHTSLLISCFTASNLLTFSLVPNLRALSGFLLCPWLTSHFQANHLLLSPHPKLKCQPGLDHPCILSSPSQPGPQSPWAAGSTCPSWTRQCGIHGDFSPCGTWEGIEKLISFQLSHLQARMGSRKVGVPQLVKWLDFPEQSPHLRKLSFCRKNITYSMTATSGCPGNGQ